MVEELLEFTRIQDGRFTMNMEPVELSALLQESVDTYKELFRYEGVELVFRKPANGLPTIVGDPQRLKQVFLNLLDNASKYGREGRKVDVGVAVGADYVTVTIRDFGHGIPAEELPYVKRKFYKGSSRERGSGIGLAICEEIVTRHNGSLTLANVPDGGVLVTVRLPLQP
jgi:signal transduction histidine kinase